MKIKYTHFTCAGCGTAGSFFTPLRCTCIKKSTRLNKKIIVNGLKFDSIKEGLRYSELSADPEISDITPQVKMNLVVKGVKVCTYIADFTYLKNDVLHIEDVKSSYSRRNPTYRLKIKLLKALHHSINFIEYL